MNKEKFVVETGTITAKGGFFHPEQLGFVEQKDLTAFIKSFNKLPLQIQALVISLEVSLSEIKDIVKIVDKSNGDNEAVANVVAFIDEKSFFEGAEPNQKWIRQDWKVKDVINAETALARKRFHYAGVTVTIKAVVKEANRELVQVVDFQIEVENPLIFSELKDRKYENSYSVFCVIKAITKEMRYRDFDEGVETIKALLENNAHTGVTGSVKMLDSNTMFLSMKYAVDGVDKEYMTALSLELNLSK